MIIMLEDKPVGTLDSNGVIQSDDSYLKGLNEFWQKEGIFTLCSSDQGNDEMTVEGAKYVKPSEDILLAIGTLEADGYQIVGKP